VQVDIPNSFDELWSLDIKKSAAFPPDVIRTRLKEITPHFINKSKQTVTYRGRQSTPSERKPVWIRNEPHHNAFNYSINREHPVLASISSNLGHEELKKILFLLTLLESTIPIESIYADMCNDKREENSATYEECLAYAKNMMDFLGLPVEEILTFEPLNIHIKYHEKLKKELVK
jgi:hypothetical protein